MKLYTLSRPFLFAAVFFVTLPAVYSQEAKIGDFAFMAGCWELSVSQRNMTITEQWMRPAGGTMIGMGRTVVGDKTVSWEALRIVAGETGLDYIAKPSQNKDETAFRLKKWSATEIIFENPEHDFPQRIIYRKTDSDSLFARIEGTRNGELRGMDIPMKRIECG